VNKLGHHEYNPANPHGERNQIAKQSGVWASFSLRVIEVRIPPYQNWELKWNCPSTRKQSTNPPLTAMKTRSQQVYDHK